MQNINPTTKSDLINVHGRSYPQQSSTQSRRQMTMRTTKTRSRVNGTMFSSQLPPACTHTHRQHSVNQVTLGSVRSGWSKKKNWSKNCLFFGFSFFSILRALFILLHFPAFALSTSYRQDSAMYYIILVIPRPQWRLTDDMSGRTDWTTEKSRKSFGQLATASVASVKSLYVKTGQ